MIAGRVFRRCQHGHAGGRVASSDPRCPQLAERGHGSWYWALGHDVNGGAFSVGGYDSQEAAQAALAAFRVAALDGSGSVDRAGARAWVKDEQARLAEARRVIVGEDETAVAYLAYAALGGYSKRTVDERREALRRFWAQLGGRGLLEATGADVAAWLTRPGPQGRPLAPASRRAYRSHLIGFYRWAVDEDLLDAGASPMRRIPRVRVPNPLPRPVSEEDLAKALAAADPRMRAWLLLMAYGGLRCLEVAGLTPDCVDLGPPALLRLRVTKGGNAAVVPAIPAVLDALGRLPVVAGCWWTVTADTVSNVVSGHLPPAGTTTGTRGRWESRSASRGR